MVDILTIITKLLVINAPSLLRLERSKEKPQSIKHNAMSNEEKEKGVNTLLLNALIIKNTPRSIADTLLKLNNKLKNVLALKIFK